MLQIHKSSSVHVDEGSMHDVGSTQNFSSSAQSSPADLFAAALGFVRRQFPIILSVVPLTVGTCYRLPLHDSATLHCKSEHFDRHRESSGFQAVDSR